MTWQTRQVDIRLKGEQLYTLLGLCDAVVVVDAALKVEP